MYVQVGLGCSIVFTQNRFKFSNMVLKNTVRVSITLFIIGFIGVSCKLNKEQTKAVSCLQNYFIKSPQYKIMTSLSPEAFLRIYATGFSPLQDGSLYMKQNNNATIEDPAAQAIKDCLQKASIFAGFIKQGDEEIKKNKNYINSETGKKYEFTLFGSFVIGLLKSTKYLNKIEKRESGIRFEASVCLSYYVKTLDNYKSLEKTPEIINAYCENPSISRFEEDYNKGVDADDTILQCLGDSSRSLYKTYKEKASKKIKELKKRETTSKTKTPKYSDYSLFAYEICDTEDWVNFEGIKDEAQKYLGLACLIENAEFFIDQVKEKVEEMEEEYGKSEWESANSESESDNFIMYSSGRLRQACEKRETLTIKGVTEEGVKFLKQFDATYLEILLHNWRKHIQKKTTLDDSSLVEEEEKNWTNQSKDISLKNSFDGLIDSYLIEVKWACLMKEQNDIPFYDWIQNDALLGKSAETLTRYLEKFTDDIINKQISLAKLYEKIEAEIKADSQINPES